MILLNLYKNKNKKMPEAYGKYYARPAITQTIGIDGLSEHMSSHNTPFSPGAVNIAYWRCRGRLPYYPIGWR